MGTTRAGRLPSTTRGELSRIGLRLFLERGFEETTVDDVAAAAGIGRRTFFRYFSSKNELPWGDFDELLDGLAAGLASAPADAPVADALRRAVVDFNTFPEDQLIEHRERMRLLLTVPALNAYSMLKYASWRGVIAEFVASRRCEDAAAPVPRTVGWACLGICLGAYETWIDRAEAKLRDLPVLLDQAFREAGGVLGGQDR